MNRILELLEELRPDCDFRGSADFIADMLLDSFDIINLVDELEEEYSVSIDDMDIVPENFSSLILLAALVEKSGGGPS